MRFFFSVRESVKWLVLHQLYKGKGGVDLLFPEEKEGCHSHLPPFFPLGVR